MTLQVEGEGGELRTLAMVELELELNGDVLRGWDEPARLTIQLELRDGPQMQAAAYFARLKIGAEDWQPWQPAELMLGAEPVSSS